MSTTRPSPLAKTEQPTAQIAKAALRRLAARAARADARELRARVSPGSGRAARPSRREALATLIERIVRGIERSGHNWTPARRKEGIQRVLAGGRGDAKQAAAAALAARQQLGERFGGDAGRRRTTPPRGRVDAAGAARRRRDGTRTGGRTARPPTRPLPGRRRRTKAPSSAAWERVARTLGHALQQALPAHDGANQELAEELGAPGRSASTARTLTAPARRRRSKRLARRVERVLQHRHHLFDQLGKLCHELTASLTDLAEDGSWVKGQCEAMQLKIEEGLSARGVRAVSDMLHHARKQPRRGARRAREGARRAQVADRRRCSPSSASWAPRPATSTRASAATPR